MRLLLCPLDLEAQSSRSNREYLGDAPLSSGPNSAEGAGGRGAERHPTPNDGGGCGFKIISSLITSRYLISIILDILSLYMYGMVWRY